MRLTPPRREHLIQSSSKLPDPDLEGQLDHRPPQVFAWLKRGRKVLKGLHKGTHISDCAELITQRLHTVRTGWLCSTMT